MLFGVFEIKILFISQNAFFLATISTRRLIVVCGKSESKLNQIWFETLLNKISTAANDLEMMVSTAVLCSTAGAR